MGLTSSRLLSRTLLLCGLGSLGVHSGALAAEYCESFVTPRNVVEIPLRRSYFGDLNTKQSFDCSTFKDVQNPSQAAPLCSFQSLAAPGTGVTKATEVDQQVLTYRGNNPEGQTFLVKVTVNPKGTGASSSIRVSIAQPGSTDIITYHLRNSDCRLRAVDLRLVQEGNDSSGTVNSEICQRLKDYGWEADTKDGGRSDLFLRPSAELVKQINQDLGVKLIVHPNIPEKEDLFRLVYYWSDITRACRFLDADLIPGQSQPSSLAPKPLRVFVKPEKTTAPGPEGSPPAPAPAPSPAPEASLSPTAEPSPEPVSSSAAPEPASSEIPPQEPAPSPAEAPAALGDEDLPILE